MEIKTIDYLLMLFVFLIVGLVGFASGIRVADITTENTEEASSEYVETTNAKPISQQQIGDGADPDILIIYEAEVDGVKVYPSVIKESE